MLTARKKKLKTARARKNKHTARMLAIFSERSLDTPYCTVLFCNIMYFNILYCVLFHALKNTANQRPGLPLHILWYAMGSMQRVVFHLYFPGITCAQQFTGIHLRTSQKPAPKLFNSCEPLRTFPITSGHFPKIFRKF